MEHLELLKSMYKKIEAVSAQVELLETRIKFIENHLEKSNPDFLEQSQYFLFD